LLVLALSQAPTDAFLDQDLPALRSADAMDVGRAIAPGLYRAQNGWLGLSLTRRLALIADVRFDSVATSPDPGRPAPTDSFSASFSLELRPDARRP
jgi:hypothetical protein